MRTIKLSFLKKYSDFINSIKGMAKNNEFAANISSDGTVSFKIPGNMASGEYLCMHAYAGRPETRRDIGAWKTLESSLKSEIYRIEHGHPRNLEMLNILGSAEALYGLRTILRRIREREEAGVWEIEGTNEDTDQSSDDDYPR